ncbi:MAG: hypothetical protein LUE10_06250 [Alistipes sp.]|nr:hypothetical protein [Alistipes sp.]
MNSELLFKFYKGTTSRREAEEIRAWVEKDPANMERFRSERKLYDALLVGGRERISAELGKRKTRSRRLLYMASGAAALLAVGFITLLTVKGVGKEDARMYTVTVPAGQRTNITLPDGTDVWLNGNSTPRHCADVSAGRAVWLEG